MGQHTAEPWTYTGTHPRSRDSWFVLLDRNGYGPIMDVGGRDCDGQIAEAKHMITDPVEIEANAARIVACVNACAGIDDPSVIPELVALARGYRTETSAQCYDTGHIDAVLAKVKP